MFGLRGINDAIYRREDRATFHAEVADNPNTPENEHQPAYTDPPDGRFDPIGSGTADMAVYQLADPQGSVVAVLADAPAVNPRLVDEVEYEPYGRARRTAQGDFNHSGSITPQDNYDFLNAYFAAAPAGDADDGGTTTTDDVYAFLGEYLGGDTTPSDRISGWSVFGIIDNPYGYCGYYADHETAAAKVLGPGGGALYSVRFRVYDPIAGRWLTRDPAGFVDGVNLYEYVGGMVVFGTDPMGRSRWNPLTWGLGGASESTIQKYRDSNCAALARARAEGKISAEQYKALKKNGHCGQSVWLEVDSGFGQGFMQGAHDGWILTANRISFHLSHDLNEMARRIWEADGGSWWYKSGAIASWIGVGAAYGAIGVFVFDATTVGAGALFSRSRFLNRLGRFFYDSRSWDTIRKAYWKQYGPANGSSLHHWLFPQSWTWVPQGIRNAGFNLLQLPRVAQTPFGGLNQWMGLTRSPWGKVIDWAIRIAIPSGIGAGGYGGKKVGDWCSSK